MEFGYRLVCCWFFIFGLGIAVNAKTLRSSIDLENFLNEVMDKNTFSKRAPDAEAQTPDQYLTETDKRIINHLISNNLIAKLMNMYAVSSRSR